eukprot:TRINITY_DN12982_c0_g1_i1.p1 TRINITY_DN12982_c0_g1~~TRINITY_DN12982_c0_g1_i1.p1  ORF type:complete len:707 (-),score=92.73 TRINITY_DN12982_c0_g1_i1:806-2926(-)
MTMNMTMSPANSTVKCISISGTGHDTIAKLSPFLASYKPVSVRRSVQRISGDSRSQCAFNSHLFCDRFPFLATQNNNSQAVLLEKSGQPFPTPFTCSFCCLTDCRRGSIFSRNLAAAIWQQFPMLSTPSGTFQMGVRANGEAAADSTRHTNLGLQAATESSKERLPQRVVVIGGGLAGLSACVEIIRHGGSVVIIEKTDRLGGNSAKASSGMNAANSSVQAKLGVHDSLGEFKDDTIKSGKGRAEEELVTTLVERSAGAVDFLQGFDVDMSTIACLGGHSHPRTHRAGFDGKPVNVGYRIMSALSKCVEGQPDGKVEILKHARAVELLHDDRGAVVGVRCEITRSPSNQVELVDVFGGAVLLATGGFCADRDGLLAKYQPALRHLATTNGSFATGDGVKMAEKIGAQLVDMDQVQLHPTAFVDLKNPTAPTKFLAPEALRGCGGLLINHEGRRFVNELSTRDAVVAAIVSNCKRLLPGAPTSDHVPSGGIPLTEEDYPIVAYLVLNSAGVALFDTATAEFYMSRGLIHKFSNAHELGKTLNLPEDVLRETLESYGREIQDKGEMGHERERQEGMHMATADTPAIEIGSSRSREGARDPFGRANLATTFSGDEELFVALVTPALHYCMGGLGFSKQGQILRDTGANGERTSGQVVEGLFGAGEVTGGLHGANRLGGNSLLECVVFGRIAGMHAWERVRNMETRSRIS